MNNTYCEEATIAKKIHRRRLLQASLSIGTVCFAASGSAVSAVSDTEQSGGDSIWQFETGDSVKSSPTVSDGTVFVGSYDGSVYAIDADSGDQQWSFDTGSRRVWASPTVVDESVCIIDWDGTVHLLDISSGTVQLSVEIDVQFLSSPVVVDGILFVLGKYKNLYAIDLEAGEIMWTFETAPQSPPTVADGTVLFGTNDGTVIAVDAETGEKQWMFETRNHVMSSPTVVDGSVFVGSNDAVLFKIDADSGELQWVFETDGEIGLSSPTVTDETVFIGSEDSQLYAVDATTGDQQWTVETGGAVASSPTVANGTVFVGSNDGRLYAVDAATGDQLWDFETADSVFSSPTVVDGTVFVGSDDSNIYAIDAGVDGSSNGSRTQFGTLGHHDEWQYAAQTLSPTTDTAVELSIDAPDEIPPDWSLTVDAAVKNIGLEDDQRGARLIVDDTVVDSVDAVATAESETLTATVETGADGERHEIVVESEDGSQQVEQNVSVTTDAPVEIEYDNAQEDGLLYIPQRENAAVSGVTTAELDSDAEIRVHATESSVSFDQRNEVSIDEDGSVETSFDTSTLDMDTELETQFWVDGTRIDATDTFIVLPPPSSKNETLSVELSRPTVQVDEQTEITVTVTNAETGEPVDGATIEIDELQQSDTTTENGESALTVSPSSEGEYLIEVTADGFDSKDKTLTVEPPEDEPDAEGGDESPDESGETVSVEVPGFGVSQTVAALGAAGYVLKRRLSGSD